MDNKNESEQLSEQNLDPSLGNEQTLLKSEQQLVSNNLPPTKKYHKKAVIVASVTLVTLATIISVKIIAVNQPKQHVSGIQSLYSRQDKDYPETISTTQKELVTREVVSTLKRKYGDTASFQVLSMEKGKYVIGDVSGSQKYFDIKMHIISPVIESDFAVDFMSRTDDLWTVLQEKYKNNITSGLKTVNNTISSVSFSLSDYNGYHRKGSNNFESIDTRIGHVPSQRDVEQLVQSLNVTYGSVHTSNIGSDSINQFVAEKKPELRKLYTYISETYPRIPEGIGATSVSIDYVNGVTIRISPLAKEITVINHGDIAKNVDYQWSELAN